jgi:hypothetical protein
MSKERKKLNKYLRVTGVQAASGSPALAAFRSTERSSSCITTVQIIRFLSRCFYVLIVNTLLYFSI